MLANSAGRAAQGSLYRGFRNYNSVIDANFGEDPSKKITGSKCTSLTPHKTIEYCCKTHCKQAPIDEVVCAGQTAKGSQCAHLQAPSSV